MAVIADDSPVKAKANPTDTTEIVKESPAQEEGFSIDKSQKILQSCSVDQDSDQEPSPPQEDAAEPPALLPVLKKVKKKKRKRRRKQKSKKIKAVVVIKGPRSGPSIFSRKFRFKLPKKVLGSRDFIVALCSILLCQQVHSALYCTKIVPVPDGPVILKHGDQNVILQQQTFCPDNVPVFRTCTACHSNRSLLRITCTAVPKEILAKPGKGNGDGTSVTMTSDDCSYFVEKSRGHRTKRSKLSPGIEPKVSKISVEEKTEIMTPNGNDDEICIMTVPVTDCPIVIKQDGDLYTFHEAMPLCPERADIWKNYSACFKNQVSLEISCRKNGDGTHRSLWVEHGKGQGLSSYVEMNSEVCHRMETKTSKIQGGRPDGEMSTEIPEGSRARLLEYSGILLIASIFLVVLLTIGCTDVTS